jgi:hypothetical protein
MKLSLEGMAYILESLVTLEEKLQDMDKNFFRKMT